MIVGTAKHLTPDLEKLPQLVGIGNDKKIVASFCLMCKQRNVPATEKIHKGCGGHIVVIEAPSKGSHVFRMENAERYLELQFNALEKEGSRKLEQFRTKYKGTKPYPEPKKAQSEPPKFETSEAVLVRLPRFEGLVIDEDEYVVLKDGQKTIAFFKRKNIQRIVRQLTKVAMED